MSHQSNLAAWRFHRAVDRIEPALTPLLVDHATGYWQRPLARREIDGERVVWTIDNEVVLEFRFAESGPSQLVVHDFSLVEPLRKTVRTRHVRIRFATHSDVHGVNLRRDLTRSDDAGL